MTPPRNSLVRKITAEDLALFMGGRGERRVAEGVQEFLEKNPGASVWDLLDDPDLVNFPVGSITQPDTSLPSLRKKDAQESSYGSRAGVLVLAASSIAIAAGLVLLFWPTGLEERKLVYSVVPSVPLGQSPSNPVVRPRSRVTIERPIQGHAFFFRFDQNGWGVPLPNALDLDLEKHYVLESNIASESPLHVLVVDRVNPPTEADIEDAIARTRQREGWELRLQRQLESVGIQWFSLSEIRTDKLTP